MTYWFVNIRSSATVKIRVKSPTEKIAGLLAQKTFFENRRNKNFVRGLRWGKPEIAGI